MSEFTQKVIEYLEEQRLGRLATVDTAGLPHVVLVAFRLDREAGSIGKGGGGIGPGFADEFIRVHPERIVGWGIDSDAFRPNARSVGR